MKKILFASLTLFTLVILGTGCLKDKDYENQAYGTQVQSGSGVGFPAALKSLSLDLGIVSSAGVDSILGPFIALESSPRSSDVHVNLEIVDDLVTNAVDEDGNSRNLIVLPPSYYSFANGGLNRTIKAGYNLDSLVILLSNSATLDPSQTYGIGLRLTGADNGISVISDRDEYLITFTIRNQYDGIYSVVSGHVTRYLSPGVPAGDALSGDLTGNPDVYLVTADATSCTIPIPPGPGQLLWAAGSNSSVAGINGLKVLVDGATNAVTMSSQQNATLTNWAGHPNDYDPATKTFRLAFIWNPATTTREYEIVLKYVGPRP
ncbi:MAG: DUF1735 domain-containing protein [Bacteroidetes bacterium]|nr:DUF1735 domain-containing protein [Bacteroidota bacterium]